MPDPLLAANVSLLFTEVPLLDRPARAARAGFDAIEMWWPFESPVPAASDLADLLLAIEDAGTALVAMNFFAGDMPAGERGVACDPARAADLRANVDVVGAVAERTGCRRFNLLYGKLAPELDPPTQHAAAADAVAEAAATLHPTGAVVLLEPLAAELNGSYPLHTLEDVLAVIDGPLRERSALNVAPLFDTFHLGMNDVDIVAAAVRHGARIGHVQIADAPGRGEPGSGALPIAAALRSLRDAGYAGPVAAEYAPTTTTESTLGWRTTL
ncbi:Xylose isomerase domain protein TIM barrel [Beutenbergia cavernae DSM 12333]|uniref:Xylose isomerase domain protein TIM barrel n=1 Tax=Beutenbergia cavernae (strain ATCC BAA-8 / DSM 12333 / CCUG 43141 / JCM 11478 / NBRC 16432 / NCIMB 13614 / HKI 0122) TaxID=471853 RepID=C5C2V6_BEUC1|nr:TIM barrel protein [Beutenbergia cavernae]ACQ81800.1 Xylose isomerase domain protein TIM barrel [Beutenbergia cavernae DSM 12333]